MKITFTLTAKTLLDAAAVEDSLNKTGLPYITSVSNSGRSHRAGINGKRNPRPGARTVGKRLPEADMKLIRELYLSGVGTKQIAKRLNVSNSTAKKYARIGQ